VLFTVPALFLLEETIACLPVAPLQSRLKKVQMPNSLVRFEGASSVRRRFVESDITPSGSVARVFSSRLLPVLDVSSELKLTLILWHEPRRVFCSVGSMPGVRRRQELLAPLLLGIVLATVFRSHAHQSVQLGMHTLGASS
jgi:hypothetical protein